MASPSPGCVRGDEPSPVVERRVCSVMFVDLVGFTPFSEERDPEDVRELLLRYFDTVRTVVARYGGEVQQFIGDAVVAFWGAPVARENDTERAVRAALDVVEAVTAFGPEGPLSARVGVVTGEVAVSVSRGRQGAAPGEAVVLAGDTVNTAARVQGAAAPGHVFVDEATRNLAGPAVSFEDVGPRLLKGKSQPLHLWRAVRVVSGLAGWQRPHNLEAPLCGRDAELRALRDLFHSCTERRRAGLVTVSGQAGVGKSRLAWELEKYVDGLTETILWHRGRCLSYGEGVAFWALAEIVRQRFGIADGEPTEVTAGKLAEGLARFVDDIEERAYVALRLGRLLGVPTEADTGALLPRQELFAGWRLFFERLADVAPVVLVVDDAHHADPALLEFLGHLVDWAAHSPVFVLVLGRADINERQPGPGPSRNQTSISLGPLEAASLGALVEGLVPGLPEPAISVIAAHAQGLPLFAVETVRSLIDRGALVLDIGGAYRVTGDLAALQVPDSLHALLAARLDALDRRARSLVAGASVLGTSFSAGALVATSGRGEADVGTALEELVRREVLAASSDRLSPGRVEYRFSHPMLRQVAYTTLSRRARKAQHLATADYLRATFADDGEEVMDVVARHYLDAVQAVPTDPDVEGLRRMAVSALERAATRALQAGAPGRGALTYQSAAELHERLHQEAAAAGAWEQAVKAWLHAAAPPAALDAAENACALYRSAGDRRGEARAQGLSGRCLRILGRHRDARGHFEVALAALRPEPGADTVEVLTELAKLVTLEGGGSEASRVVAEALQLAEDLDVDDSMVAELLMVSSLNCNFTNRPVEAAANLKDALHRAERAGATSLIAMVLNNLSDLNLTDNPKLAAAYATAAMVQARRVGSAVLISVSSVNTACAQVLEGDWEGAARELDGHAEPDDIASGEVAHLHRARLAALRGEVAGSPEAIARLTRLTTSETVMHQALLATARALAAAGADQACEALAQARAALRHVEAIGPYSDLILFASAVASDAGKAMGDGSALEELLGAFEGHPGDDLPALLRAELDLVRARLAGIAGDAGAGTAVSDAVAAFRRAGSPWHLARALVDQAEHLRACGQGEAYAQALDEAQAIAYRLGALPLARAIAGVKVEAAKIERSH